ncbi:MAG: DUF4402 domain-containing protein [Bacteroidales bacterium]
MKTLKILFAVVIITGFASSAVGQDNPDTSIDASATIFSTITITGTQDINFGGVEANSDIAELDPQNSNTVNFAGLGGVDAQLGIFDITGENNASITITVDESKVQLTNGDNQIDFTPEFAYAQGNTNADGDDGLSNGNGNNKTLSAEGKGQVFVGGELGDRTGEPAGLYENKEAITVSVEYN